MGIEPTMPLLSQSIIGFEDRGRHQSGTRFHGRQYTEPWPGPSAPAQSRMGACARGQK
jgi:hypothetical protein